MTRAHVASIPFRNAQMVSAGRYYGLTIATCVVADPESKGGSEATVRIAEADLVPCDANLLPAYATLAQFDGACEQFGDEVNNRVHRVTKRVPAEMLVEERARLHRVPEQPYTVAFGRSRTVGANTPVIALDDCGYSVPHRLRGEVVWAHYHGEQVVITHVGPGGAVEVPVTSGPPRAIPATLPPISGPRRRARCTGPVVLPTLPRKRSWRSGRGRRCG